MEKRKKTLIWSKISQKRLFTFFGRFALIRSNDRQALAALGGLTIEVDHMSGVEPENSGDVIHVDDDSAFSAYRDNAEDSDSSDVEG